MRKSHPVIGGYGSNCFGNVSNTWEWNHINTRIKLFIEFLICFLMRAPHYGKVTFHEWLWIGHEIASLYTQIRINCILPLDMYFFKNVLVVQRCQTVNNHIQSHISGNRTVAAKGLYLTYPSWPFFQLFIILYYQYIYKKNYVNTNRPYFPPIIWHHNLTTAYKRCCKTWATGA